MPLFVFAGFPRNGLHAGGLQYAVEEVEELTRLEHDPTIQYRREGVFQLMDGVEKKLHDVEYRISDLCLRDGITYYWFPENWSFGNGITVHKTTAIAEYKTVIHGTDLSLEEYLALGPARLADLLLERTHLRHEGWAQYASRWVPGTCPQVSHQVHLTWVVTKSSVPELSYCRIRALVEDGAEPKERQLFSTEPGKHFSEIRRWDGKPAIGVMR